MDYDQAITLLDLPTNFNESQLNSAFRKKSLQYHPDRIGGDSGLFNDLNDALNILKELPDISDIIFMQTMFPMGEMNNYNKAEIVSNNAKVSEIIEEPTIYTIPITIKDYYYGKSKKIKLSHKEKEIKLTYNPISNKKFYEKENIILRTRILDDENNEYLYDKTQNGNRLIRYWKISLYEYLYSRKLKVKIFNEILEIERNIGGNHENVAYFTEKDFNIYIDQHGFYTSDKKNKKRGSLLIKLIIIASKEDLENNREPVEDAFPALDN